MHEDSLFPMNEHDPGPFIHPFINQQTKTPIDCLFVVVLIPTI